MTPLYYLFKCASSSKYEMTDSLACFNGTNAVQGIDVQRAHGDQTTNISLSFVPSIEFDNVMKAEWHL